MKKLFSFSLISLFIISALNAQGVNYGAKAGGNLANFTNNDEFEYKFGLHFGVVAEIELSENFSVQPELLYSAQGYKQNFEGQKVKAKVDYFNIPILANFTFAEGLSLQAGPQIGINIRKDREVDGQDQGTIFVNDVDISAIFGFQYLFDESFFMQARGAIGLTEVVTNIDNKNFVISVSLGFFIDNANDGEDNGDD